MAIQNRRGQSADFVASKMVPGEFAVSQDNRKLYLCFTAGNVKEIAIAEDMANAIAEMNLAMEEWHDEVVEDTEDKVEDAEAWAQGTRGGTPVPSTDPTYQHNAKYYAENIVDNTLSIAGKAADAKKTGDEISDLKDDLGEITETVQGTKEVYTPLEFSLESKTATQNGLTIVQNTNGTVHISGTASALTLVYFTDTNSNRLSFNLTNGETYRLRGCPSGGSDSTYRLDLRTSSSAILCTDYGNGYVITISAGSNTYYPGVRIPSGATVDIVVSLELAIRSIITGDILSAVDLTARDGLSEINAINKSEITDDLDIVDNEGNVIVCFSEGQLKTKEFDSRTVKRSQFYGSKISVLGDSISTFVGFSPSNWNPYYPTYGPDVDTVKKMWYSIVADGISGTVLASASWGASGVCGNSEDSTGNVGSSSARIEALSVNGIDPDVIFIEMGTNDWSSNRTIGGFDVNSELPSNGTITDFSQAYAKMLSRIMSRYPTAMVFCMTISARLTNSDSSFPIKNSNGITIPAFNEEIRKIASIFGAKIININSCGISIYNLNVYAGEQQLHPNAAGHNMMAQEVLRELFK